MRTLLLADDSITVQRVIALTFAERGRSASCSVATASRRWSGSTAQRPDIVLAGTDAAAGRAATTWRSSCAAQPELQDVPVLLLTGAFETVDEAQLKASGANGVIEKPVEPTAVISRVKELLGLKSACQAAPHGGPAGHVRRAARRREEAAGGTPPRAVDLAPRRRRNGSSCASSPASTPSTRRSKTPSTRSGRLSRCRSTPRSTRSISSCRAAATATARAQSVGPARARQSAPPIRDRPAGVRETSTAAPGNPVFEVDDDWFGAESATAEARAGRREIAEDCTIRNCDAGRRRVASPIFEVDDDWFAEDDEARAASSTSSDSWPPKWAFTTSTTMRLQPAPRMRSRRRSADDRSCRRLRAATPDEPPSTPSGSRADRREHSSDRTRFAADVARPHAVASCADRAHCHSPSTDDAGTSSRRRWSSSPTPPQPRAASRADCRAGASQRVRRSRWPTTSPALLAFEHGERRNRRGVAGRRARAARRDHRTSMLEQIAARVAERLERRRFGDDVARRR